MPRRSARDAALTRQGILAAARVAFSRHGYDAATATDIAAAAGVTRGAFYHHFATKADLFREVFIALEHELNEVVQQRAIATLEATGDAHAAFVAGCRAWLEFATRADYQQVAMADAPGVLGLTEWHRIDSAIGLSSMETGLGLLHEAGLVRRPVTRALATLLFGALTEAGLALARDQSDLTIEEVTTEWVALIEGL